MKRILLALSLSCAVIAAHAENWTMVQESDNGSRLLVDIDSYRNNTKGDDGTIFVAAMFRFFSNGEAGSPFLYITEADSCKRMNGTLYSRKWENGKWVTTDKFWWSKNGSKMYDSAGELLCDVYNKVKTGNSGKNT